MISPLTIEKILKENWQRCKSEKRNCSGSGSKKKKKGQKVRWSGKAEDKATLKEGARKVARRLKKERKASRKVKDTQKMTLILTQGTTEFANSIFTNSNSILSSHTLLKLKYSKRRRKSSKKSKRPFVGSSNPESVGQLTRITISISARLLSNLPVTPRKIGSRKLFP